MTKKTSKRGASPKTSTPNVLYPKLYGRDGQPLKLEPRSPAMRAVFGLLELLLDTQRNCEAGRRQVLVAAFLQDDQVQSYNNVNTIVHHVARVLVYEYPGSEQDAVLPVAEQLAEELVERIFRLRQQSLLDLLPKTLPEPKPAAEKPTNPPAKRAAAKSPAKTRTPAKAPEKPPAKRGRPRKAEAATATEAPKPADRQPELFEAPKPERARAVRPKVNDGDEPKGFDPLAKGTPRDEMYDKALLFVRRRGHTTSISDIAHELRVGRSRAEQLVQALEANGDWPDPPDKDDAPDDGFEAELGGAA